MSTAKSISYVLQRFLLRRKFLLANTGQLKFHVRTEDVVGRHIYKYGQHDPAMSDYLRRTVNVQSGDVLIDIGANIGWYSVLFSDCCRGTDANVLCFEPDPMNYGLLEKNLAANNAQMARPLQLALSDNDAGAELHLFSNANRGRHSLLPINDGESIAIQTARLDDVLTELKMGTRTPRLIKIDVEGFEFTALRGAPETLQRCPLLILEYSPEFMRRGDIDPAALLHYLKGLGFTPALLENGREVPITLDTLLASDQQRDLIWRRQT